jgi:hypothetical protein
LIVATFVALLAQVNITALITLPLASLAIAEKAESSLTGIEDWPEVMAIVATTGWLEPQAA